MPSIKKRESILFRKVLSSCLTGLLSFSFLLTAQEDSGYDEEFIDIIEFIYGENYLSQGGKASVNHLFQELDLYGKKLLDIGCGIGGPCFDLAREQAISVVGIDCESFLINQAKKRFEQLQEQLRGEIIFQTTNSPFLLEQFANQSFNVIFSKEAILHIPEEKKQEFFHEMYRVLKEGGNLILCDWFCEKPYSNETIKMMEMDGVAFHMVDIDTYVKWLQLAGFTEIRIEDHTDQSIIYTQENLDLLKTKKAEFIQRFGEDSYEYSLSWELQKKAFENREIVIYNVYAKK